MFSRGKSSEVQHPGTATFLNACVPMASCNKQQPENANANVTIDDHNMPTRVCVARDRAACLLKLPIDITSNTRHLHSQVKSCVFGECNSGQNGSTRLFHVTRQSKTSAHAHKPAETRHCSRGSQFIHGTGGSFSAEHRPVARAKDIHPMDILFFEPLGAQPIRSF